MGKGINDFIGGTKEYKKVQTSKKKWQYYVIFRATISLAPVKEFHLL